MLHTFVGAAGKRLIIKPNPIKAGTVLIQILTADREVQASMTLGPACCVVAGEAMGIEAASAEQAAAAAERKAADLIGAGVGHD